MSRKHKRGSAGHRYQLQFCNVCKDRKLPEALRDGVCLPCIKDPASRLLRARSG